VHVVESLGGRKHQFAAQPAPERRGDSKQKVTQHRSFGPSHVVERPQFAPFAHFTFRDRHFTEFVERFMTQRLGDRGLKSVQSGCDRRRATVR
jgi:hypothetical protein